MRRGEHPVRFEWMSPEERSEDAQPGSSEPGSPASRGPETGPLTRAVDSAVRPLVELVGSHGALEPGSGLLSGILALALSGLSVLAVLAYRFPAYLTTPELRRNYDPDQLRYVLAASLVVAGSIAIYNLVRGRSRWLAAWAFSGVVLALALGGPTVPVGEFPDHTPYVGLDWLVLDLLGSALVFVFIEKLVGLRKEQPIFRAAWQTDLVYFAMNHLLVGVVLVVVNRAAHGAVDWASGGALQAWVHTLPFVPALLLALLAADLAQYWLHRAFHEFPVLWRFHAIHHSTVHLDWLAGSRVHLLEAIVTRTVVLAPLLLLGFSEQVLEAYVIVVGFQAVFNHANVSVRLGPLSYVIVTPNFHHFHHSRDGEAIDRNYAAHFAFLDYLFGTAVSATRKWPNEYGVVGDDVPHGYLKQLAFPFVGSGRGLR